MRFGPAGRGRASRTRSRLTVGSAPRGWLSTLVHLFTKAPSGRRAAQRPRLSAEDARPGGGGRGGRFHAISRVPLWVLLSSAQERPPFSTPVPVGDVTGGSGARRGDQPLGQKAARVTQRLSPVMQRNGMGGKVALQRGWRGCSDTRRAARGGDSVASAAGARAGPPPSVCAAGAPRRDPTPRGRRLGTVAWEGRGACRDRRGNLPERFDLTLHYVWIFFPSLFLFFWKYFRNKVTSFSSIKVYILTTG